MRTLSVLTLAGTALLIAACSAGPSASTGDSASSPTPSAPAAAVTASPAPESPAPEPPATESPAPEPESPAPPKKPSAADMETDRLADAVLEQLKIDWPDTLTEGAAYLQKWVPDAKWISAPFLFDDRAHWVRFTNGPMVQGWIADARKVAGITVIGDLGAMVRGPYRVLVTRKPVTSLADMKGLKLRLHPDKLAADVWGFLGTETRVLPWTEVYQSINSGIVQAVNSPIALFESMRFY